MISLNYVTGDTPVLLNINDTIVLKNIEDIAFKWIYLENKEYSYIVGKIWSSNKWCDIKKINRYIVNKNICRIITNSGILDIEEDSYLIDKYRKKIKLNECIIDKTILLHSIPLNSVETIHEIGYEEAFIMGLFFINGQCSIISGFFEIRLIEEEKKIREIKIFLENYYFIYLEMKDSILYCSYTYSSNNKLFIKKYRDMMYYNNYKYVPVEIMNSNVSTKLQFIDGVKYCKIKTLNLLSKITTQSLYLLTRMSGVYCDIYEDKYNNNLYHFEFLKEPKNINNFLLKNIKQFEYYNSYMYVYNIETCNNKFQAGIGQLVI
jgi:hypothetical protein